MHSFAFAGVVTAGDQLSHPHNRVSEILVRDHPMISCTMPSMPQCLHSNLQAVVTMRRSTPPSASCSARSCSNTSLRSKSIIVQCFRPLNTSWMIVDLAAVDWEWHTSVSHVASVLMCRLPICINE